MCKKILFIISILTLSMFIMCCGDDSASNNTNSTSSETNTSDTNNTPSKVDKPDKQPDDITSSNDGTVDDNIYNNQQEINSELLISYPKNWTPLSEADNSYLIDNITTTNLIYKKLDSSTKEDFISNLKSELSSYNLTGNIEENKFTSKNGYKFTTLSFNTENGDIRSYEKQYILFSKEYSYIFTISSSSYDCLNNDLPSYENFINKIILK